MLHNINTIQNLTDIAYNTSYTDKYLINALANAGQRLGIKGDSISIGSFTFKDLIKESPNIQSIDPKNYNNYNGFIFYDIHDENKIGRIGLIKKGKVYTTMFTNQSDNDACRYDDSENIFNKLVLNNAFAFDNIVNNIEYYTNNNIIEYDDDYLYNLLYGKIIGVDDSDNNNIEIIYNKYNDSTNRIELAIRVFHLYNNGVSNVYCMLVLKQVDLSNYVLEVYQFDTSLLGDIENKIVKNKFESLFNYSNEDKSISFSRTDIDYKNESDLFYYKNETDCTLFGLIKYHELNNMINHVISINVKYNSESNQLFFTDDNNKTDNQKIENINTNILGKKNETVESRLYYFSNDIIYNLPNYIKLYSEKNFVVNNKTLYSRIMFEVYEYLYEKYNVNGVLYVPLDYKFNYLYNQNNELQIFHSEDILLSIINIEDTKDINGKYHLLNDLNKVIFDNEKISNEIFENIKFNINYNNINDKYPSSIDINHIYTLPYINENNLWVLNDVETDVKAIGKNAGNPNIIILNNYKVNDKFVPEMSAANINLLKSFDHGNIGVYEEIDFILNPNLFIDNIGSSSVNFIASGYLPKINESNISLFENCLIFLISSKDTIKNLDVNIDEEDLSIPDYFSSIWYVDNKTKQFNYVRESNKEYALDLTQILNTHYIIQQYSKIYSSDAERTVKNLKLSVPKNIIQNNYSTASYALLSVEDPSYYDEYYKFGGESSYIDKYQNGLNLSIKFNKLNNDKYLDKINQNSVSYLPYIKFDNGNNGSENNNVTLYKYEISSVKSNISYISKIIDDKKSNILECNYVDDTCFIIVTNEIDDAIDENIIYNKKVINSQGWYKEYVFNSNVPSLDLKEILMVNSNTLNRLNVISVDSSGKLYNSYIGSSQDDDNKNTFIIGTTPHNINVGNSTLIDINQTFNTQNNFKVNFDNIELNGVTYLNGNTYLNKNFYADDHNIVETKKLLEDLNIKKYNVKGGLINTVYEFNYDKYSYLGRLNDIDYTNSDVDTLHISYNTLLTYNDTFGIYKMCTKIDNSNNNVEPLSNVYKMSRLTGATPTPTPTPEPNTTTTSSTSSTTSITPTPTPTPSPIVPNNNSYYIMEGNLLGIYNRDNENIYNNDYLIDGKPIYNLYLYKHNIIDGPKKIDTNSQKIIGSITGNILNNIYSYNYPYQRNFTTLLYLNNIIDEHFKVIYGTTLDQINNNDIKIRYYISSKNHKEIIDDTLLKVENTNDNNNTYNVNFHELRGLYSNNEIINNINHIIKLNNKDYFIELPYSDEMFENYVIASKNEDGPEIEFGINRYNKNKIPSKDKYISNYPEYPFVKLSNDIKFLTYQKNDEYILEIYYKGDINNLTFNLGSKNVTTAQVTNINLGWIDDNYKNIK